MSKDRSREKRSTPHEQPGSSKSSTVGPSSASTKVEQLNHFMVSTPVERDQIPPPEQYSENFIEIKQRDFPISPAIQKDAELG
ncbi:unnamed protein product [Ceratitis capitata]|uniref:(Mediterranean fruit fly) hypothetical protein n=1 Tax=Ceratitis capitata TaxID=7213 RepID=A0A811URL5_CERCA|nr:unnamed protein product [Ceratitis capitata]